MILSSEKTKKKKKEACSAKERGMGSEKKAKVMGEKRDPRKHWLCTEKRGGTLTTKTTRPPSNTM